MTLQYIPGFIAILLMLVMSIGPDHPIMTRYRLTLFSPPQ
jgi:hypothetical protein